MGFFHSENFDRPKRALPPRQQAILQSQGQLESDECLAAQRRAIPGVEQMRDALEEIEIAQAHMHEAGTCLRMVLNLAELAKAYGDFQAEGGVTASDWGDWVDGKSLGGARHAGKRHLRIVSARIAPSVARRPTGTHTLVAEGELAGEESAELAEYDRGDGGPEVA